MILGFKKQFVSKILRGEKIHTIREDPNDRWKPDREIHFATGVRTKNYEQFHHGYCYSVERIEIRYDNKSFVPEIYIEKELLSCMEDHLDLARNDGFEGLQDFYNWFDKPFKGKIIHWTDLKYIL